MVLVLRTFGLLNVGELYWQQLKATRNQNIAIRVVIRWKILMNSRLVDVLVENLGDVARTSALREQLVLFGLCVLKCYSTAGSRVLDDEKRPYFSLADYCNQL